jgi:antitoxin (DNA-binding transcriptional repressor) of toxin-antitoxin stability system
VALSGTEVIITSDGEPLLKIIRMEAPKRQRKPGLGEGRVIIHDNFDDPLPDSFWLGEE